MTNNHGISCLEGQPIGASSHWKECSYDGEIRGVRLPQAMGSGPLAQPLFYQYKCTLKKSEPLHCNGSKQSRAMRWRLGKRSEQGPHSARNKHPAAQPRAQTSGLTPGPSRLKAAAPPQPRESSRARHPITGPGAEGGGGWPMHATAQLWHAEGQPSSTAARRQRSQAAPAHWCPWQKLCGQCVRNSRSLLTQQNTTRPTGPSWQC